jgi:hypothetical protein
VHERALGAGPPCGFQQVERAAGVGIEIIERDRGGAVDAALALPVYLRDKVAQTMAERAAIKLAAAAGEPTLDAAR